MAAVAENEAFQVKKHLSLLNRCLKLLPGAYASLDGSRLDLLNKLNVVSEAERSAMVEWLYSLQMCTGTRPESCGFRGNIYSQRLPGSSEELISEYESAHIAQTYSALCCLLILGDSLERVNRTAVLKASESDMRFVFCAVAVSYILNDFSFVDVEALCGFVRRSVSYDGGIGQGPGLESHGGSTYCAVASLCLLGRLWDGSVLSAAQLEQLRRWAVLRQAEGFHGRTNKPDDSCYAFWTGATLWMLNSHCFVDRPRMRRFLLRTQDDALGGFAKYVNSSSDILHTYFGIAALAIFSEPDLSPIYPPLNVPVRAFEHLGRLHRDKKRS